MTIGSQFFGPLIDGALGAVVIGLSSGMSTLITFTQIGGIDGGKGKIVGLNSLGISIGSICGPIIGGIIGDIFSMSAIFLSLLLPYVALTLYTLYYHKRIKGLRRLWEKNNG